MRAARGFTLIELLVALFAMALLAALSWRGIDGMMRARDFTARRATEVSALQVGLDQWTTDLEGITQFGSFQPLDWNGRVLRLTRADTQTGLPGVRVVAWTHRDGQWLRWQSAPVTTRGQLENAWQQADLWSQNPSDDMRRQQVAIVPLDDWQIFYYRNDAWTNPLSSDAGTDASATATAAVAALAASAPVTPTAVLPDGIRLVLQLPGGQAITGTLVRDWVRPTVGGGKTS